MVFQADLFGMYMRYMLQLIALDHPQEVATLLVDYQEEEGHRHERSSDTQPKRARSSL
jgi:hypothetical protein